MKKATIMLVCFILGILMTSIVGCAVPTRGPNFNLYDKVIVGNAVGIVTQVYRVSDGGWAYAVVVHGQEVRMEERNLTLQERIDWNEKPKDTTPEIIIEFGTPIPEPLRQDHSILKDRTA